MARERLADNQRQIVEQHKAEAEGPKSPQIDPVTQLANFLGGAFMAVGEAIVNDPALVKAWTRGQFEVGEMLRALPSSNAYKGDLGLMTAGGPGVYGASAEATQQPVQQSDTVRQPWQDQLVQQKEKENQQQLERERSM